MNLTTFYNDVYILTSSSCASKDEGEGPFGKFIDFLYPDPKAHQKSFEDGEQEMIDKAINLSLMKATMSNCDIDLFIGGDLLDQLSSSNQTMKDKGVSFLGVYGACSTFILALIVGSIFIDSKKAKNVLCFSSSNYGGAERQFRYPLNYGIKKKETTTITASGAASIILTSFKKEIRIVSSTLGSVEDPSWDDYSDLGNAMAYGAFKTICAHLKNSNKNVSDYDLIVSGDLSSYGANTLKKMLLEVGIELVNFMDSGNYIYNDEAKYFAGGSGAACIGICLSSYIIKKMISREIKNVLIIGTGALHSKCSVAQKKSVPVIAHAIELERV